MNKELDLLIKLQNLDYRIKDEEAQIHFIPLRIKENMKPLNKLLKNHDLNSKNNTKLFKEIMDHEINLDDVSTRLDKSKTKKSEIKTNKVYTAYLKELDTIEKIKLSVEDKILEIMEELSESDELLKKLETKIKDEENILEKKREVLDKEKCIAEENVKELLKDREQISKQLDIDLYLEYTELFKTNNGIAVSRAEKEVCTGCNMNIPPQLFVEVISNDNIRYCTTFNCRRFLYYDPKI